MTRSADEHAAPPKLPPSPMTETEAPVEEGRRPLPAITLAHAAATLRAWDVIHQCAIGCPLGLAIALGLRAARPVTETSS